MQKPQGSLSGFVRRVGSRLILHPVQKFAQLLVERHDLTPPVDVHGLAQIYADVEVCDWPYDCDGVAILNASPKIFLKQDRPWRRERFTLAHELGHVIVPWHVNAVDCKPHAESGTDTSTDTEASVLGTHQELEANQFASHLLVPDRHIAHCANTYVQPSHIFELLADADISAAAGMLAIQRVLLPGYAFIVPGLRRFVLSAHTHYFDKRAALRNSSYSHGVVAHEDVNVEWYLLTEPAEPVHNLHSKQEATKLLRAIAESARWERGTDSLIAGVNGVIGAARSAFTGLDAKTWLGVLLHRFSCNSAYAHLVQLKDFREYLSFRACVLATTGSLADPPSEPDPA